MFHTFVQFGLITTWMSLRKTLFGINLNADIPTFVGQSADLPLRIAVWGGLFRNTQVKFSTGIYHIYFIV